MTVNYAQINPFKYQIILSFSVLNYELYHPSFILFLYHSGQVCLIFIAIPSTSLYRNLISCNLETPRFEYEKAIKQDWNSKRLKSGGKCKIQWMKFLYFYERHVFAYDIFEIQFGTCFIAKRRLSVLYFFCFEIPMTFFLLSFLRLPQLVFISLLAALNKKKTIMKISGSRYRGFSVHSKAQ